MIFFFLNDIHPTVNCSCDYSFTSIPFLDVNFSLHNGKIVTDLYTKPADKPQYLLHSSCHPIHTKRAIPFSLALRLRRICSTNETFTLWTNELISCGHTTDFYLGKTDLPRANSSKICLGKFISGFVLPR